MARVCEINADPAPQLRDGVIHLHESTAHVFLSSVAMTATRSRWKGGTLTPAR
jgi:hypothetical protein